METGFSLDVQYYRLSAELQPFFTALYLFNIVSPVGSEIEDWLHPEWAGMRFTAFGSPPAGGVGLKPMTRKGAFVVSGPTSKAIHFQLATSRIWGLGLQPAGWAKFVGGRADDFADLTVNGSADPAFALFAPLLPMVQASQARPDRTAEAINAYLMDHVGRSGARVELVRRVHDALRDPEVAHVAELSVSVGIGLRSLERICLRYFGFPPKLLLRRQRFLRSLGRYMLDPQRNWSEALDRQYHDQAQFVRDFRSFMGMTPTEYAEHPHPILNRIMAQRMADLGAAPETDLPTVLRYRSETAAGEAPAQEQRQRRQRG
jgi:AraC-like DNA-binding protein